MYSNDAKSICYRQFRNAFLILFLFASLTGRSQLIPFAENFAYPAGNLLGQGTWTLQGSDNTNPVQVVSPGLSYAGYQSSGIGLSTQLTSNATGQDLFANFTGTSTISSGSLYIAALVKVSSASRAGDYFLSFKETTGASLTVFKGRLYAKDSLAAGNLVFGVTKSASSGTIPVIWTPTYFTFGKTYLVVLKYTFVTGSTTNDVADIFVFDPANAFPTTEPVPNATATDAGTDGTGQRCVQLRQGATNSPVLYVDGIRVGTTWSGAVTQDLAAPVATFVPSNGSINIAITAIPTITFNEPVRKTDGSDLTNADLASLITFKKTNSSGVNVPFTATIDATKTVITVTPVSSLNNNQVYYLSAGPVQDGAGNNSGTQSASFTTVAATSNDATLSNLLVNGTTVAGFSPTTYIYPVVLPYGSTVVPTVTATANFPSASVVITPTVSLPGTTTVHVTAQDGVTQLTYSVVFTIGPPSTNSALSYIKWLPNGFDPLKQNIRVKDFVSTTFEYAVELPSEITTLVVDAEPDFVIPAAGCPPATYTVTQPVNLTGTLTERTATVVCTAQDGITTSIYHVVFSKESASLVFLFKEGFNTMPPTGWANTSNVGSSATNGMGLYGSLVTFATPKFKWVSPSDGGTLTTTANNGAGTLRFFVKVLDKNASSNLHFYVEKSYDNSVWSLVSQDPMPLYVSITQWHQVVLPVNDNHSTIYFRFRATAGTGDNSTGLFYLDDVSLTQASTNKTLNLTGVKLEGLYNGVSTAMNQASDDMGPHWGAGIADHITVELHDASSYSTIIYSANDVVLDVNGTASIPVPGSYSNSYYITIKQRNSIETVSATAPSFSGNTINQSFASPSDVFGGNLRSFIDGGYAIYGGDVSQDGLVDGSDMAPIDNEAATFSAGYIAEDCNGDGLIDGSDMAIADNNAAEFIGLATP